MNDVKDPWGEDDAYPRQDWQYEVANGDTSLGYWTWVAHQKERDRKKSWWEEE